MAAANVEKMTKQKLRALADEMGVTWDKRTDDEESLRRKVTRALALSDDDGGELDLSKRANTTIEVDPKTKKPVKRPIACFGWYYNDKPAPGKVDCDKECPHATACAKLSRGATAALGELEEEAETDEEAEAVSDEDVEGINAANKRMSSKSKKNGLAKGERLKGTLDEETKFRITFDADWVLTVEDKDFRRFYKALLKEHGEEGVLTGEDILAALKEYIGLPKKEGLEFLPTLLQNKDFKLA